MKETAFVLTVVLGVVLPSLGDRINCRKWWNQHGGSGQSRSLDGVHTRNGPTTVILGEYGDIYCEKKGNSGLAPWLVRIYDKTSSKSIFSGILVSPRHILAKGSNKDQDELQPGNLKKLQVRFHGPTHTSDPLQPGVIAVHWYNKAQLHPWVILTITKHDDLVNFPVPCTGVLDTATLLDTRKIEIVYWTGSNEDGAAEATVAHHAHNHAIIKCEIPKQLKDKEQVVAMMSGEYQDNVIGLYSNMNPPDHADYLHINEDVKQWIEKTMCLDNTSD